MTALRHPDLRPPPPAPAPSRRYQSVGYRAKRLLLGPALTTSQLVHERVSKRVALAVFSSDPISSTAYATEEILLVLVGATVAGGALATGLALPVALAIVALLALLVVSYRQVVDAYPSAGGAYVVSRRGHDRGRRLAAGHRRHRAHPLHRRPAGPAPRPGRRRGGHRVPGPASLRLRDDRAHRGRGHLQRRLGLPGPRGRQRQEDPDGHGGDHGGAVPGHHLPRTAAPPAPQAGPPPRLLQRHHRPVGGGHLPDRGLPGRCPRPDPAVRHRRCHLLHPRPGGHDPPPPAAPRARLAQRHRHQRDRGRGHRGRPGGDRRRQVRRGRLDGRDRYPAARLAAAAHPADLQPGGGPAQGAGEPAPGPAQAPPRGNGADRGPGPGRPERAPVRPPAQPADHHRPARGRRPRPRPRAGPALGQGPHPVPLELVDAPDRNLLATVEEAVAERVRPDTEVTVLVPRRRYVGFWRRILHDQTSAGLTRVLGSMENVNVTIVPFHLGRQPQLFAVRGT